MLPRLIPSLRQIARLAPRTAVNTTAPCATTSHRWLHTTSTSHAMPPHHTPHTPPTPQPAVKGMLTLNKLTELVQAGTIESVIVGFPDMYGRMMGKRFDAEFFIEACAKAGTHACDYLLASDMEMVPQPGYDYANWERGFGDFHLVPDLSSLRLASWQDGAALVLCDLQDEKTHQLVHVAPRSILRKQLDRAAKTEFKVLAATELEYYTYEHSYREAAELEWSQKLLKPVGDYYEDYHLLQTAREEKYTKEFRKHLKQSGIPVENSKGECGIGQHELNIKYSDCLQMADRHLVYKQVLKEVADQQGASVTFMAKPFSDSTGSGCHIHLSLHHMDGKNAFAGDQKLGNINCSETFKQFLAGWLKYTPDVMPFYAPTINSYKRFVSASWAPTRIAWSYDNRTAGYRVVGSGKSLRIECRIPGADVNPYLAFAGSLASGLAGIEQKLTPPDMFQGDIYQARQLPEVPKTLTEACNIMEKSDFAKHAFGEDVVKHYLHFYRSEQEAYNKAVTDWERKRYFERI